MGRARGATTTNFISVLGNSRGSRRIDATDPRPNPETVAHVTNLGERALAGDFAPALWELRLAGSQTSPLLLGLSEHLLEGVRAPAHLSEHERENLMVNMGLSTKLVPPAADPGRARTRRELEEVIAAAIVSGDATELLAAVKQLYLRVFALGLADLIAREPWERLEGLLGGKNKAAAFLETLPGIPKTGPPWNQRRWASERLTKQDWRNLFDAALSTSDPGKIMRKNLQATLYSRAHEHAEFVE